MDSFILIFRNYRTNGLQWQRLGVSRKKVLARNRKIEKGSAFLWSYIESIVNDAVEKGFLKP